MYSKISDIQTPSWGILGFFLGEINNWDMIMSHSETLVGGIKSLSIEFEGISIMPVPNNWFFS